MKILMIVLMSLVGLNAVAHDYIAVPVTANWTELNGNWESIESEYKPGSEIRGRLTFSLYAAANTPYMHGAQGDYQLTSICSFYDGTLLQSSVKTRVSVNGNQVQTWDPVQSSNQLGNKYCTASIPRQIFNFEVKNNVLIMYTNIGKYYFQRVY
ncbi:MAG: hypothetical protein ACK5WZ_07210 [Pseudobdellovibrionaceae bacterium]